MTATAATGTWAVAPLTPARLKALTCLVVAYDGHVHRLLRDVGDHLGLSLAYVDRATVEAHLEHPLMSTEWELIRHEFRAMDFDDHVGDRGTVRTDWIEAVLERARVAGHADTGPDCRRSHPVR